MIGRTHGGCTAHQTALIEFADRRERTDGTLAALAHIDRCRRCEDDLAGIVRTIAGLRGLAESASMMEPGAETWPRLRDRVSRREPQPRGWTQPLGGLMAAAVVALLVLPSLGGATRLPTGPEEDRPLTFVNRYYETPPGALTAAMMNAMAGEDISKQARLRSTVRHTAPSNMDRDEGVGGTILAGSPDRPGVPIAIGPS